MAINLKHAELIYPYFVVEGKNKRQEIGNFPGIYRFSVDRLLKDIEQIRRLGLRQVLLFGIPADKDLLGASAYSADNIAARAARAVKDEFKDITVITDVCLCAYTRHGHCGILSSRVGGLAGSRVDRSVTIDNKETLKALARTALSHAEAGADWVAPSAMAKRQVAAIRLVLDKEGFHKTKIMGYSAKFASNFYGPFRNAAGSAPRFGDRSGYQLDPGDSAAALKEIEQDIKEGADAAMVKPALSYLDIINRAKQKINKPLAAYNVSGEYSMVKYGARKGLWDERKMVFEVISAIKRAGADFIITYHAKDIAAWQKTGDGSLFSEEKNPRGRKRTVPIISHYL